MRVEGIDGIVVGGVRVQTREGERESETGD